MAGIIKRLKSAGVMGINRRNADFTLKYNKRSLYPLVDDKFQTKQLALRAGIAVPDLYHVFEIEHEIQELPTLLADYPDFVVKPARGSGGDGIIVITGQRKHRYRKASGAILSESDLKHHVSNILSGMYSLAGQNDKALIEYRVKFDPVFNDITYLGVPDIRIIVFLGVPVMAMLRLPTRQSDGRANLHQGAIGAGIDMNTGTTLTAVSNNQPIDEHPDTGEPVTGVTIPGWEQLLKLAADTYSMTGLGYQGVDIVLDKDRGPLLLEINARPGLSIQIANQAGLLPRLKSVESNISGLSTPEQRIAFARQNFSSPP